MRQREDTSTSPFARSEVAYGAHHGTVGTRAACLIADFDQIRLKDCIVHERYTCAPRTSRGVARAWAEDDILALIMFSDLVKEGWNLFEAGRAAHQYRALLAKHPDLCYALMVFTGGGFAQWQAGDKLSNYDLYEAFAPSSVPIPKSYRVWFLAIERARVRDAMRAEREKSGEAA